MEKHKYYNNTVEVQYATEDSTRWRWPAYNIIDNTEH